MIGWSDSRQKVSSSPAPVRKLFMHSAKTICVVLAFAILLGGWRAPWITQAQSRAYAVQVAALQSRESAETLTTGLCGRGLEAYWVKVNVPGQGTLYRVRIGKFSSLNQARAYAERLRQSGLLDQYSIAIYEPPTKIEARPPLPVIAAASPKESPPSNSSAAASIVSPPTSSPTPSPSSSALGADERKAIILIASRQWAAPAPPEMVGRSSVNSPPNLSSNGEHASAATPASTPSASPAPPLTPPPPPLIGSAVSMAPREVSPTVSRPNTAPTSADTSQPPPALNSGAVDFTPPQLQGVVESQGGQLHLIVRNLDLRRPFKGVARVMVSDGLAQNETAPIALVLPANEEREFALRASLVNGTYTLMIYDETGALQIMRGASIGTGVPKPKTPSLQPVPTPPPPENDITIVPRQIATTSENITLEFEITSQRPLGYISLVLRVGNNFFDSKNAVLSGTQGRIPFLVPVRIAETVFNYELKDDQGRILMTGEDDLRRIIK